MQVFPYATQIMKSKEWAWADCHFNHRIFTFFVSFAEQELSIILLKFIRSTTIVLGISAFFNLLQHCLFIMPT